MSHLFESIDNLKSRKLSCTVTQHRESQWYGTLVVSNIEPVTVQKWLSVSFESPTSNVAGWGTIPSRSTIWGHQIGTSSTFRVTAKFDFSKPYTLKAGDTITFGINGDLNKDYAKTLTLLADPAGIVKIQCAPAPDKALVGCPQALTFKDGSLAIPITVIPGKTSSFQIFPGIFTVKAAELINPDQTIVGTAQVVPATVTITDGKTSDLSVTYSPHVDKYSAINVNIGNISPLQKEHLHVKAVKSGQTARDLWTSDHTIQLRRLPPSGIIDIGVDTTVNNVQYLCDPQSVHVSPALYQVSFPKADKKVDIPTTGFVTLPIVVKTDCSLDANVTVCLVSVSPVHLIYAQQVKVKAGITNVKVPVSPGKYTVQALNIIHDYTVYVVEAPTTLTVAPDGTTKLQLEITHGANLKVTGFPDFLGFGGMTDLAPSNEADFVYARASSIFKYAGFYGNGDPDKYLDKDTVTVATVQLAYNVTQKLEKKVLPVMISYTCNLSGGVEGNLHNEEGLAHSFGNLILAMNEANNTIKGLKNPSAVPVVGFIVNPDLLGACQQKHLTRDYKMAVGTPLKAALKHWNVSKEVPSSITDTLGGYVLAVNWLIRTIASTFTTKTKVTFGWQVNLWGVGSSQWIYGTEDPAISAEKTAKYAKDLGVFDGPYHPDFLAIDRYEADDFTSRAIVPGYCFGPHEWVRFYEFCAALSVSLKVPVMPWQIPSSHTPLLSDSVSDIDEQHWGTGGSYLLGDPGVNSDYHNVNPNILALEFPIPYMGKNAEEMFKRGVPFDWTDPAYLDFPRRGIFAVLLGGGEATGIVSSIGNASWARKKLHDYKPIPLDNTPSSGK